MGQIGHSGTVHYSSAMTNGYYVVLNVIDPWKRIDARFENYYPTTSQFHDKAQAHEQKHVDDLNKGFDGHVFFQKDEYEQMVIGLTSSTIKELRSILEEKINEYVNKEVAEMSSLKFVLEQRAHAVSDAIPPFYVYQGECGGLD